MIHGTARVRVCAPPPASSKQPHWLEPAVATGCAEKRGPVSRREQAREGGKGPTNARGSSRQLGFKAQLTQSRPHFSVAHTLSPAALRWDHHKGTEARLTCPKCGSDQSTPRPQTLAAPTCPQNESLYPRLSGLCCRWPDSLILPMRRPRPRMQQVSRRREGGRGRV